MQPFVPQLVQEHGAHCYWLPFTAIVEHAEFVECAEYVEYAFSLLSYALTCFVCFPSNHQVQYSSWKTNHVPAVSGRIAPETHRQHLGLVWRCLDSLDNVLHVLHCSCYAWSQAFQLSCSTAAHSCNHDLFFSARTQSGKLIWSMSGDKFACSITRMSTKTSFSTLVFDPIEYCSRCSPVFASCHILGRCYAAVLV